MKVVRLQENQANPDIVEQMAHDREVNIVLYTRTWSFGEHNRELTKVWKRLKDRGIHTASFHLDLYVGMERQATIEGDPFWTTEYVFTADGDPDSQAWFEAHDINHIWSPPAVVKSGCYRGEYMPNLAADVIFVGSDQNYHPTIWPYRQELCARLRSQYGPRFHQWGHGRGLAREATLNNLFASVKCVVGDSLCPGYTKPNYTSDRLPETIGRHGALIYPNIPGIAETFGLEDGTHCLFYDFEDWDGLFERIDWLVAHTHERELLQEIGGAQIRRHHTYSNRIAELLRVMGFECESV